MVRVGVDESISNELLAAFPSKAEIVRIPLKPSSVIEVDFWILPFGRKDTREVFAHLRGVKVAQSLMAGVDWVLPWLPKDIVLCDGRGVHDISTSEWVLSVVLATMKRLPVYRDLQQRREWRGFAASAAELSQGKNVSASPYHILGEDLAGKTVLIVGYGSIGSAIEERMKPFGVNVLRIARTARPNASVRSIGDLHELLPQADIVVLIVPNTEQTRGLIGAPEMTLMKRGALLVNAARGPVVVTDALVAALEQGHVRAALDVTDPEPLPAEHPLWLAPNCLITPHVAGSTPEFIHRGFRMAAEQVRRYVAGEPLENVVTAAGY